MIPQREYFDKSIANSDNTDGYYIIEQGDFVYNPRKSSDAPYGPVSIYKHPESGIVSPLYLCFRALKSINSSFYDYFFKSPSWHRYIYLSGDSGARHDRVSIKDDVFFSMPMYIPSEEEQLKVSSFLSLIEKRIADQQQLVEHLKKYKRGVSEQLFEQIKSKSTQHVFSSIFVLLQNNTFSRELLTNEETEMQNIHYGDVLIKYGSCVDIDKEDVPYIKSDAPVDKFAPESYLMSGDVVIADTAEDYTVGKATEIINPNNKKILSGLHTIPCRPIMSFAPMFMGYYLNSSSFRSQIMPLIQGTKVSSIGKTQLMKTTVYIPPVDEQKRIADFLYSIDTKINLLSETADKMIQLKSAMLQQLFI